MALRRNCSFALVRVDKQKKLYLTDNCCITVYERPIIDVGGRWQRPLHQSSGGSYIALPQILCVPFSAYQLVEESKTSLYKFESKPETVPISSYAARRKPRPIVEVLC